jgi:hypothetical protein
LTGLTPGLYVVTVTDENGNTSTSSIVLTQAALLTVSTTAQNVSCNGAHNGSVTANPAGGCGPYTYTWNNGAHTQTISGLAPGTYSVTISDSYGCSASASGVVTQPTRLVADAGSHQVVYPAYAPNSCATLSGVVSGGTPAYSTSWTTRNGQVIASGNSATVCPTVTTVYYFHATDANGCSSVDSVAVCPVNISCGNNSIRICHTTPGRHGCSSNQCVPVSQVAAHLSHGDQLGRCGQQVNCNFPRGNGNCGNGGSGSNSKTTAEGAGNATVTPTLAMRAFPNPTSGMVEVEITCQDCGDANNFDLKVTDIYGHVLIAKKVDILAGEGSLRINLSDYAAGVYMISVNDLVQRVMKQ